MQHIGHGIAEILERARKMSQLAATSAPSQDLSERFECPQCRDVGYILDGLVALECSCLAQKRLYKLMKNAMIPEEFQDAEFSTYRVTNEIQRLMYESAREYVERFDDIRRQEQNSLGFIAKFGERRLREIRDPVKRGQAKRQHNNFGLGKTHLQIAIAKELIRRGVRVLVVSDVTLMGDLSAASQYDDEGEELNRLLWGAINADVLIWDDIGKAKTTDFRLDMYYRIINERYKARRPIVFSSNEDAETLAERIGDAAASRLFGMSRGRVIAVEGPDYRVMGA
mgnify:FL=1